MSARVDNVDVGVPEASPETNEKQDASKEAPKSRRNLWIGLAVVLVVIITVAIAVPLSLKKDDNKDEAKTVAPESANISQMNSAANQCFEPKEGDDCTTQESYQQCMDLVNSGCKEIISTFSCPPMHVCGDQETPVQLPASEQCPPPSDDNCSTEASHKECMDLVNNGCQKIYSTRDCPPQHRCGDEPVLSACTMELNYCADGTAVGRSGVNCHFEACPDGGCPIGTYHCGNGVELLRDPALGCEFPACPELPVQLPEGPAIAACTMELNYCADGTAVGRTAPHCHYEPCPDGGCPAGTYTCDDGTELQRDPALFCEFPACPEPVQLPANNANEEATPEQLPASEQCPPPIEGDTCNTEASHKECLDLVSNGCQKIYSTFSCPPQHRCGDQPVISACTMELAYCEDGTAVGRSGLNCHFEACPDGSCPTDTYDCGNGVELLRDPALGCEFQACPEPVQLPADSSNANLGAGTQPQKCTRELAYCADGSPVGRAPPNCHFEACPDGACPIDTYTCDDGTELLRDPALGCEFQTCPEPVQLPANEDEVMCTMDVKECPDGSFANRVPPLCMFAPCPPRAEPVQLPGNANENANANQGQQKCTRELAYCADGSPVGREPPSCHFQACPDGACPIDTYTCDDGTVLNRDPSLGCEFQACPEPTTEQCQPPEEGYDCETEESYQECLAIANSGCQTILSAYSCPPQYFCGDEP